MVLQAILAIFIKYGLTGLFLSSFLSSLVFIPAYSSFLIPLYVGLHFSPWQILIAISIGAVGGELVNYYLGFVGSKYVKKDDVKKAEKWLTKWGEMSVFIVNLIPAFPADVVNALVGFFHMDLKTFVIGMSVAKVIQYALLIFGSEILFNFVSII